MFLQSVDDLKLGKSASTLDERIGIGDRWEWEANLIGTKVWSPTFNSKNITVQTRHTRNTTVYIQRQRFSLLKALNALA